MTYWGTNSYVLGRDPVAIVDPGPRDAGHLANLMAATDGARVKAILVTHAHKDHSEGANALALACGAPVLGFGPAAAGRSKVMEKAADLGALAGGEGVDHHFTPERTLSDGESLQVGALRVTALHTPGHFAGHLSFQMGDAILTGDVVMGWSTTLISPPDGDVRAFLQSCGRLRALDAGMLLPGHGPVVSDPRARIDALVAHRILRGRQVLSGLDGGPASADALAARIYNDLAPALLPAAARNVLSHLIDLWDRGLATPDTGPLHSAEWSKAA